jgi:hypothetical protein
VWKRGSSIDTHREARKEPRFGALKDTDVEDEIVTECMRDTRLPLDQQVIDKVDTERFLDTLDSTEKAIVVRKVYGYLDREIRAGTWVRRRGGFVASRRLYGPK